MLTDLFYLISHILLSLPTILPRLLTNHLSSLLHSPPTIPPPQSPPPKTILILGASFAGFHVAQRLLATLPPSHRVVLVERNSHLHYVFAFPRFSVIKGWERWGFIPYTGLIKGKLREGWFRRVQGEVIRVGEREVELESGEVLGFEVLVVATGMGDPSGMGVVGKLMATGKESGMEEMRRMQEKVEKAGRVAVLGGGAVGVQVASDVKGLYPEKEVVVFQAGGRLVPGFGERLGEYVEGWLRGMGVEVRLGERPKWEGGKGVVNGRGEVEEFDLVIPCTGQRPNSAILSTLSPSSISVETSRILVKPSLQILDEKFPHIFALGDVAATGGPRMARAALFQADVVAKNILALIRGGSKLESYKPNVLIEGAIKLTLGKTHLVIYTRTEGGREILIPLNMGREDLGVKRQWGMFGVDARQFEEEEEEKEEEELELKV